MKMRSNFKNFTIKMISAKSSINCEILTRFGRGRRMVLATSGGYTLRGFFKMNLFFVLKHSEITFISILNHLEVF